MNDLDELRWMLNHFEPDALEVWSKRIAREVMETLAILVFGAFVVVLTLG